MENRKWNVTWSPGSQGGATRVLTLARCRYSFLVASARRSIPHSRSIFWRTESRQDTRRKDGRDGLWRWGVVLRGGQASPFWLLWGSPATEEEKRIASWHRRPTVIVCASLHSRRSHHTPSAHSHPLLLAVCVRRQAQLQVSRFSLRAFLAQCLHPHSAASAGTSGHNHLGTVVSRGDANITLSTPKQQPTPHRPHP